MWASEKDTRLHRAKSDQPIKLLVQKTVECHCMTLPQNLSGDYNENKVTTGCQRTITKTKSHPKLQPFPYISSNSPIATKKREEVEGKRTLGDIVSVHKLISAGNFGCPRSYQDSSISSYRLETSCIL